MTFSIKSILLLTAWIAIILSALAFEKSLPDSYRRLPMDVIYYAAILFFAGACIGAIIDRTNRKPFWIGYVVASLFAFASVYSQVDNSGFGGATPLWRLTSLWMGPTSTQIDGAVISTTLLFGFLPLLGVLGGVVAVCFAKDNERR